MKYKLKKESGLFRVVALRDIPLHGVKAGDVGGLVEGEHNLDQAGDCWVGGNARVSGDAKVCGSAILIGGTWTKAPLQIHGSRDKLCVCSPTEIAIGCKVLTAEEWLEKYEGIGKEHGYSEEEIAEYKEHIECAISKMKL